MKNKLLFALALCALGACDANKSNTPAAKAVEPQAATTPEVAKSSGLPDVGKVEQVAVSAKGVGMTPGAAVNEALKNAIMQVNGVTVDATSANLNVIANAVATVDVYSDQGHDHAKATSTLQGQAYADQIVAQSNGVVSSFKVTNIVPPPKEGGQYLVDIEAKVAKYVAPADNGKIKIVVAPLRSKQRSFDIGGQAVPAADFLAGVQRQIVDSLSQTGRFIVLDRQFGGEIQSELDMITFGETVKTDMTKLGQALSADLIWVGEVNNFGYAKHVRQLQTSDRELVSYSGGWSISQRVINLATRQIQQASTLQGSAPSVAPTTMGRGIGANQTQAGMQADLVKKATESILLRTFPISVVERDGNQVILSQGGSLLRAMSRYRVYVQGKELKDPQTGQSLGKMESLCCDVVINRVMPNISYATLENVQIPLDNVAPGALQLREALPPGTTTASTPADATEKEAHASKPTGKPGRSSEAKPATAGSKPKEKDDW